jgi:hypothetical protein
MMNPVHARHALLWIEWLRFLLWLDTGVEGEP